MIGLSSRDQGWAFMAFGCRAGGLSGLECFRLQSFEVEGSRI